MESFHLGSKPEWGVGTLLFSLRLLFFYSVHKSDTAALAVSATDRKSLQFQTLVVYSPRAPDTTVGCTGRLARPARGAAGAWRLGLRLQLLAILVLTCFVSFLFFLLIVFSVVMR